MNLGQYDSMKTPEQLAGTALIMLEQAVLTILFHEQSDLAPEEISKRLGITRELYGYTGRAYPIVASVLKKLEREGRVEPDSPRYAKWRLTEAYKVYLRGAEKFELKKYAAAIEDFDAAIRLDPKNPLFYIDRAVSKQFLKQFQGALADIDEAIHLWRDNSYLLVIRESIIRRAQLPMNQENSQER